MILKFSFRIKITRFVVFLHFLTAFLAIGSFLFLLSKEIMLNQFFFLGIILIITGVMLVITAFSSIKSQAFIPKNIIINKGIYRHIRNPIYLGLIVIAFGSIFLSLSSKIIIYTLLLGILYQVVIKAEEKELTERFGKEYQEYSKKVPSLIPRFKV